MLDWDDLRFFLAVARSSTMSAAARSLRVAQPTVGRRIAAFEKRLGARLFARAPAGWALSPTGRRLLPHAERMEHEVLSAEMVAAGRDEGLEGRVRITASEWIVRSVLGPALAPFATMHPRLELELVADARHLNLARREADIAIRPSRFKQLEIHQREVALVEFGLYASDTYLARYGSPDFSRRCHGHVLVALTDDMNNVVDLDWLPPLAGEARIAARDLAVLPSLFFRRGGSFRINLRRRGPGFRRRRSSRRRSARPCPPVAAERRPDSSTSP
jgi:DNA-binding transcriptional LysR family regulator